MDGMMTAPPQAPSAGLDDNAAYLLFRDRVVQEDCVLNHRMTWLLASQALALALFAAAASGGFRLAGVAATPLGWNIALWTIAGFGCFFAFGSGIAIRAAECEIDHLKTLYAERFPAAAANPSLPSLVGHRSFHGLGHVVPRALPWTFCLLWVVLVHLEPALRPAATAAATIGRA